ncbi:D-threo-aldose 1-dehydrogenase [Pseudoduganella lurida]|uniref:D-threo-aldose 1-dehydrogenase n=1 Tax=Pseudoduganella lurida TaxID=1036180 RepID=A0A562RL15_9BURK|nr:aldo/keto reductase [Pseudoduganella lurida]TWI69737.1 D-threo-aldose 1-dehydrogenase [Pseudoduganella lurida]
MESIGTRSLAQRGLSMGCMGLGCAQLGGLYQPMAEEEARAIVDTAWSLGIRYFDTAPYYGYTLSERRLGAALRDRARDDYVVSTKVGRLMVPDDTVQPGDSGWAAPLPFRPQFDYTHDGILRSHEGSLQRLGLDRIDILYVHDIGRVTHGARHAHYWHQLTEGGGFRALLRLRDEGAVRAIGLGVNEWEVVADALDVCDIDCALLAGRYTLLEQGALALLDHCAARGVGIVIGGPFNSGILAGVRKFDYADAPDAVIARADALAAACRDFDVPLPAAALQFPMAHPAVVSCIPGAQNPEQLRQNAAWFAAPIPADVWQALARDGLIDPHAPLPSSSCHMLGSGVVTRTQP